MTEPVSVHTPTMPRLAPWLTELRALGTLAVPLAATQLAQMAMVTTDLVMIGRLGETPLAAAALGATLWVFGWLVGHGPAAAVAPVVAQMVGARPWDKVQARACVRMGLWAVAMLVPPLALFFAVAEPLLRFTGQSPALAALAAPYVYALACGLPFEFGFMVLRSFATALSRPHVPLYIVLAMIAVNLLGNYVLVFGHGGAPALGLVGSGIASAIANALSFFAMLAVVLTVPAFRSYRLWRHLLRPDWAQLKELFGLGLSIGLAMVFEVMLFSAATLMMGRLGTAPLAAHQIALNVPSITFMVPLGIGMAATIRVGLAAGAHNRTSVRRAGLTAMALGGAVMIVFALGIALFARTIAELYLPATPDTAEAGALTVRFLHVAAAFQLFDGIQVIGANALRGLKDARLPMLLAGGAYWLVGFPLALVLGFVLHWHGVGIWLGLACSLAVAAVAMALRFAYVTSPQQWSKADASGWRAPTAPC
jgi:MATE family multidrug resistance protein